MIDNIFDIYDRVRLVQYFLLHSHPKYAVGELIYEANWELEMLLIMDHLHPRLYPLCHLSLFRS